MALWAAFLFSATMAVGFHWMARHPERKDVKRVRLLYWGTPSLQALGMYAVAIIFLLLLILRARGIDILGLWEG